MSTVFGLLHCSASETEFINVVADCLLHACARKGFELSITAPLLGAQLCFVLLVGDGQVQIAHLTLRLVECLSGSRHILRDSFRITTRRADALNARDDVGLDEEIKNRVD